jgi:glycosyltransferase involved in cell wall biosynthesis
MSARLALICPNIAPFGTMFALQQLANQLDLADIELHVLSLFDRYQTFRLEQSPAIRVHQLSLVGQSLDIHQRIVERLEQIQPDAVQWWGISPRAWPEKRPDMLRRWRRIFGTQVDPRWRWTIEPGSVTVRDETWSGGSQSQTRTEFQRLDWSCVAPNANESTKPRDVPPTAEKSHRSTQSRDSDFQQDGQLAPTLAVAVSPPCPGDRPVVRRAVGDFLQIPSDAQWIVTVADLVPENQLKDLIWGLDLLHCIRDDVHLLVIGRGPQLPRLQRFAELTESASQIHWLGLPDDADRIVAAADVYWQAHLNDVVPQGMMLAMAARVPVVSAWGQATAPLVIPQQTAWAVPLGGRDQFARWTKYILENPEATQLMVDQAQRHLNMENRLHQSKAALGRLFGA